MNNSHIKSRKTQSRSLLKLNTKITLLLYGYAAALPPERSPFDRLGNPPPLRVVRLGLESSTSSFGLLGDVGGARVDDVATFARSQCGIDQLLVFLTAAPVGAGQRLPGPHHHLKVEAMRGDFPRRG